MRMISSLSTLFAISLLPGLVGCSSEPDLGDGIVNAPGSVPGDLDGDGEPDDPNFGSGGGGADVGGSGGGVSAGTGGTAAGNPELACVGDFLIDDFSDPSTYSAWRAYDDASGGSMQPSPGSVFSPEQSTEGGEALHLAGSGFVSWGAGIGRAFDVPSPCQGRSVGFRFRAKGNGAITIAAPVAAVVPPAEGGTCTLGDGCHNSHETSLTLNSSWTTYEVRWSDLAQGWGTAAAFEVSEVLEILFAARLDTMPFDYWIDDIELIDDGSPVEAINMGTGGSDAGTGGSAATGGGSSVGDCALDEYLGESGFSQWFSARRDPFYTYANLCEALKDFPGFANTGNADADRREIAAFFANVSRETGELDYIEQFPESRGNTGNFYGRGPLQLTWDYNYRDAGSFLGVNLVSNPNLLHTDGVLTWKASLWFWMHSDGAGKGTCHGAITGSAGFGQTINVINGGLECPSGGNAAALQRIAYYEDYCSRLGVAPGSGLHC